MESSRYLFLDQGDRIATGSEGLSEVTSVGGYVGSSFCCSPDLFLVEQKY